MKKGCEPNCFSTLGYNVAYCYSVARVMKWLWKQALNGFQGVTGSFEWFARTMQGRTEKVDVTTRTHFTTTAMDRRGPVPTLQTESGRSCSPPYVELRIA